MSIHQMPLYGPEDHVIDLGQKTVPLTVWIKDGHLVNPGQGERVVIGEADVDGTTVSMTLMDIIPDAVMDSLIGDSGAKFSIGFTLYDD